MTSKEAKSTHKILFIYGTRPEGIKLAPLIKKMEKEANFTPIICSTGQHKEMLNQVHDFFNITPHYNLNLMTKKQSLLSLIGTGLIALEKIILKENPACIVVQGDTSSTLIGSLVSAYQQIPLAHVEAGLRSYNKKSPFPEEINRVLTSHIATYHFTHSHKASENLKKEGLQQHIKEVGNTGIDALLLGLSLLKPHAHNKSENIKGLPLSTPFILVTCHRRENFGAPFQNICKALLTLAKTNPNTNIIFPVHLNPNIYDNAHQLLGKQKNIYLSPPLDYKDMITLMQKCLFIVSDSGGIQEEAPSLGKPVLVLRKITEREEGIDAGTAILVGTSTEKIILESQQLLDNKNHYTIMSKASNPYGTGNACKKICIHLESTLEQNS
jgi:UDP-N-acetylglucosamine 2-epimerase (non-hydrolysing)